MFPYSLSQLLHSQPAFIFDINLTSKITQYSIHQLHVSFKTTFHKTPEMTFFLDYQCLSYYSQ